VGTVQATVQTGGTAYITYEVFQQYQRRGIARAAVSTLITHLFAGEVARVFVLARLEPGSVVTA
jgi:RimJ/RimL family protein N-acetyltransferase